MLKVNLTSKCCQRQSQKSKSKRHFHEKTRHESLTSMSTIICTPYCSCSRRVTNETPRREQQPPPPQSHPTLLYPDLPHPTPTPTSAPTPPYHLIPSYLTPLHPHRTPSHPTLLYRPPLPPYLVCLRNVSENLPRLFLLLLGLAALPVGMVLKRRLAVGFFNLRFVRASRDTQQLRTHQRKAEKRKSVNQEKRRIETSVQWDAGGDDDSDDDDEANSMPWGKYS